MHAAGSGKSFAVCVRLRLLWADGRGVQTNSPFAAVSWPHVGCVSFLQLAGPFTAGRFKTVPAVGTPGIAEEPGLLPVQLAFAEQTWLLILAAASLAGIGIIAGAPRLPWQTWPWLSSVGE